MKFGTFKRWVGNSVELWRVPEMLGIEPKQVGALVKRKALPVYTFRTPEGRAIRMVRRQDLQIVRASLREPKPKLCDFAAALEAMAAQP